MKATNIEYLFNNLKNGDMAGFHFKKWHYVIGKIINLFSFKINPQAGKMLAIEHIGMFLNVERNDNKVYFDFAEMTGAENKTIKSYCIVKKWSNNSQELEYLIDSFFKRKGVVLYLLQHKYTLNKEQLEICNNFWKQKEEYSVKNAILSVNYFQKIWKFFKRKQNLENVDNFCSGAVHSCNFKMGFQDDKDIQPSPSELSVFSYVGNIVKIN